MSERMEQLERMLAVVDAASLPGGATAARGEANPPLLTGGLRHGNLGGDLLGVGVDFLTCSMPCEGFPGSPVRHLLDWTGLDEPGGSKRMFKVTERRLCLGGECWRMMQPGQGSKRWGQHFESWEWASGGAAWAADFLRGKGEARPSRVDVAFDLAVDETVTSDAFMSAIEKHRRRKGLADGISGQDGVNTRYVGSTQSERRVRVYRKDLQSPALAFAVGPMLRVELVLKGKHARAWWDVWEQDRDEAKRAAAAHLLDMTGVRLLDQVGAIPELELPEGKDEAEQLALFVEQNGQAVASWIAAGVDLVDLCQKRAVRADRRTKWRWGKRIKAVRAVGAAQVVALAKLILGMEDAPAAQEAG